MLFSRKYLWKMILPLIIQQSLSVTIGMLDSIMVSSAGEAAVSGVSLVGMLDILLIEAFFSLSAGGSVVVAQAYGKNDVSFARKAAKQLLYAVSAVALLISAVVLVLRRPLLHLLFGSAAADVMQSAQSYFFYILLSFPFLAIYNAGATIHHTMGKTAIPMATSILMNVINVAGNATLIYGYHMGAAGAAIATLISRIVGAVIMVVLVQSKKNDIRVERILHYRPDFAVIKRILRIGVPNGVENSMFQFGKLLTQSLISSMGTVAIAANAVAQTLANVEYMPGAINAAMISVVGRCVGAEEKKQAKQYAKKMLFYAYALVWIFSLGVILFSGLVLRAYHLSDESAVLARKLILYHSVCCMILWPSGFILPSALRAASDVKFTLYVSAGCMWVFRVALGYVLASDAISLFGFSIPGLGLGVMGVWLAMSVDWIVRVGLYLWRFLSGKWLTKYKPIPKN